MNRKKADLLLCLLGSTYSRESNGSVEWKYVAAVSNCRLICEQLKLFGLESIVTSRSAQEMKPFTTALGVRMVPLPGMLATLIHISGRLDSCSVVADHSRKLLGF